MSAYVPVRLRRRILTEANGLCAYCRSAERLMGVLFEIEHIIPLSAGGETLLDNLCLACPTCNRFKASRISAADPVVSQETRLYHPCRDRWLEHFAWSDGGAVVVGLTSVGRATIKLLQINRPNMVDLRRYWAVLGLHPPA